MELKRIVAIVRTAVLEQVEDRLKQIGVKGVSISRVKGYGEYANLSKADWMCTNARIEVFVQAEDADAVIDTILQTAHSGSPGDGLVALMPVERLYRIRTGAPVLPDEI